MNPVKNVKCRLCVSDSPAQVTGEGIRRSQIPQRLGFALRIVDFTCNCRVLLEAFYPASCLAQGGISYTQAVQVFPFAAPITRLTVNCQSLLERFDGSQRFPGVFE